MMCVQHTFVIELIMKTHLRLLNGVLATEATGTVAGFLVYLVNIRVLDYRYQSLFFCAGTVLFES